MASAAQIEANRRNARKSTGPRTDEGKARASRNATKHGLTSRLPVLPDEDPAIFEEFRHAVSAELRPLGTLETAWVNRIAALQWRLARVPGLEAAVLADEADDPLAAPDPDRAMGAAWTRASAVLDRLQRYEAALQRQLSQSLRTLRTLQAERRAAEQAELQREAADPWERLPLRPAAPSPDGVITAAAAPPPPSQIEADPAADSATGGSTGAGRPPDPDGGIEVW